MTNSFIFTTNQNIFTDSLKRRYKLISTLGGSERVKSDNERRDDHKLAIYA